jgi:hypothetical protein
VKAARAWSPWSPAEAARWAAVGLAAHATVLIAWWLVHREASFDHQVRWVALGVAGFIVAAYGDVSWLLRARGMILDRRRTLLPDPTIASAPISLVTTVVAGPDLGLFHRPDCALARGKGWPALARTEVAGRRPCGVCEP